MAEKQPPRRGLAPAALVILFAFYLAQLAGNGWSAIVDDEVAMIATGQAHAQTFFTTGPGMHSHPPLHSALLWLWMELTGARLALLRVSSITFYVLGILLCALAVREWAGDRGLWMGVVVGVLWPLGLQLGPLQAWYGLSFFFAAGLTWTFLGLLRKPETWRYLAFFLFGIGLLSTTYFGWVVIGCLGLIYTVEHFSNAALLRRGLYVMGALVIAFLPLLPHFAQTLAGPKDPFPSLRATLAYLVYNAYALLAGESIAPWFFPLGIPVAFSLILVVLATLRLAPRPARSLLLAGFILLGVMALTGILASKRILTLGPWVVVPVALALCTDGKLQRVLTVTTAALAAIALLGMVNWTFFAAPRFAEPWEKVAAAQADAIRRGALVLAANPSFCFHMTNQLEGLKGKAIPRFVGVAPWSFQHPQFMDPAQWEASGHAVRSEINLVLGAAREDLVLPTERSQAWLDGKCRPLQVQQFMRDPGFQWKTRFFPGSGQREWRIEVRSYDCRGAMQARLPQPGGPGS